MSELTLGTFRRLTEGMKDDTPLHCAGGNVQIVTVQGNDISIDEDAGWLDSEVDDEATLVLWQHATAANR